MKGRQIDRTVILLICVCVPFDYKLLIQPSIFYTFFNNFGRLKGSLPQIR